MIIPTLPRECQRIRPRGQRIAVKDPSAVGAEKRHVVVAMAISKTGKKQIPSLKQAVRRMNR